MKIFIDIGHPAHVHYFRNFIKLMTTRGHSFLVTARDREHVASLLESYDIPFVNRGKGGRTVPGKIGYLIVTAWRQYLRAKTFGPDLFLDFSTMYSGLAAWLLRRPYITFTDTENTGIYRRFIKPFCKAVYTPLCFTADLGSRHHRFNGVMELAYLHPRYFEPDPSVLETVGLKANEKFAIVRFVGWNAVHDRGKRGFSDQNKRDLVKTLQRYGRVFISAEGPIPPEMEPLRLKTASSQMHHMLFYATVLAGESATMTSEAAILGTPAVCLSGFRLGYLAYMEDKYGLVLNFGTSEREQAMAIKSAATLMGRPGTKENAARQAEKVLDDHVDVTRFMIDVAYATIQDSSG